MQNAYQFNRYSQTPCQIVNTLRSSERQQWTVVNQHFPMVQSVKNMPAMWETWVWSLGWVDPLEEGMATHSSILAWRIPMDRRAWWVTAVRLKESRTGLKQLSTHGCACFYSRRSKIQISRKDKMNIILPPEITTNVCVCVYICKCMCILTLNTHTHINLYILVLFILKKHRTIIVHIL